MKKKDYLILLLLAIIPVILVFLIIGEGKMFGHNIDWISQHTVIPDYFRQLFYKSGDLFPDFASNLGGGANIFAFSYYGLFRPDVLIGYLLPNVDMSVITIDYMILMMSLGACLNYIWLRKKSYPSSICAFVSFLLVCSSFFFHAHKQIMFVNFIPYLIMALMSIDYYLKKNKSSFLIISIFLIILHSYFFSIAAIIICSIYYLIELQKSEKLSLQRFIQKDVLKFAGSMIIAILLAAALLVPTALVILENSKSVASTSWNDIFTFSLDLKGLLYNNYGCGLTMIAWISLLLGIQNKKTRWLSIMLIISFLFPIVSYILNGTLYARTKILIVMLPLVLLVMADVLNQIKNKGFQSYQSCLYIIPLALFPIFFIKGSHMLMIIDLIITIALLAFYAYKPKWQSFIVIAIIPLCVLVQTNSANEFLDTDKFNKLTNKEKLKLIDQYADTFNGRCDDFSYSLSNANRIHSLNEYKTTSYTSTNNSLYNAFYYDIMKNPVSIANRVANLANSNIFFQGLMGVSTIYSNNVIPIGYNVIDQNEQIMIARNENVLPIAYATNDLFGEEAFNKLKYPYTLDTIYNNAIVKKGNHTYQSKMQKETLDYTIASQSKNLTLNKAGDDVQVNANKNAKLKLQLNNNLKNKIVLISFDLKDIKKAKSRETIITINGVKNKLSKGSAAYPNGNKHFTYILSDNEDINQLNISFSKGNYKLSNLETYTLDYDVIKNRNAEVTPLNNEEISNKEIMKGKVTTSEDGYFITSLPYQKGYKVYVDGVETASEIVNKAFLGFPLSAGEHTITIEFRAPGKTAGMLMSLLGCILLVINYLFERGKKNEQQKRN